VAKVIVVNGKRHRVKAKLDTPLMYVLREELQLDGPLYGCGLAQCGACAVLVGDAEARACITPVSAVDKPVTTLEGLPGLWAKQTGKKADLHPVQQAWIDEQVPQCGYCQNGMMITAADLLTRVKRPTETQIKSFMNGHLCRCGTYNRIITAIQRASKTMA
jgi:aerobic-type carbon monoxide dehydrogenase small subunit (CoxS/CutS family)